MKTSRIASSPTPESTTLLTVLMPSPQSTETPYPSTENSMAVMSLVGWAELPVPRKMSLFVVSLYAVPSVNDQHLAGDVTGIIRGQKQNRSGEFFRFGDPF